jgi:predicted nucleic acid-binding protein
MLPLIAIQKAKIIDLTTSIAINASRLSLLYDLPMADCIILYTAQSYNCIIWTQDSDFENLPGVKFFFKT